MISEPPPESPEVSFAELLRQLRTRARITQEELAFAAGLSPRSISDLERGISRTARKDTADRLADVLTTTCAARRAFVAAARGRALNPEALPTRDAVLAELAGMRVLRCPHDNPGLKHITLTSMIDAMRAEANGHGSPVAGIWLIGLAVADVDDHTPRASESQADQTAPTQSGTAHQCAHSAIGAVVLPNMPPPARFQREGLGDLAARVP
jgi:transcriptional regulator with XRE-family HTH domain